jgi:hypothetical protein
MKISKYQKSKLVCLYFPSFLIIFKRMGDNRTKFILKTITHHKFSHPNLKFPQKAQEKLNFAHEFSIKTEH